MYFAGCRTPLVPKSPSQPAETKHWLLKGPTMRIWNYARQSVWVSLCACSIAAAQTPTAFDRGLLPGDLEVGPATNSQLDHSIARGGDQYLVAWTDFRGRSSGSQTAQSDGDIFGIRLDSAGNPVDAAPFLIAGGMGLQQRPRVA